MTQEEKAKRYDEALERARKLQENSILKKWLWNIFPELKESEDERIKRELCKAIWTYIPNEEAHEYIAWLEKQGKKKSIDYTHTNVFTEKVAIWFNNNFIVHDEYGVISDSFDTKEEMFEDFKNYMKEN